MTATLLTEAYHRRISAFHEPSPEIPLEEFYSPAQPRDREGQWTRAGGGSKVWSGVSANPYNRKEPKSKVSFPIEPDDYQTREEARVAFASRIYDADLGDGYQARVVSVRTLHNGVAITIKIRNGHKEVATATREISSEQGLRAGQPNRLVVHHETLYIDSSHQNKGIADRFNAHAVAQYQRLGVDRIDLHAGGDVGGYAWARQGFRIFEGDRKKFLHEQLDRLDTTLNTPNLRPHAKRVKAEAAAMRKAIDNDEDVQPIHLASLGEKYARHTARDDHGNTYSTWPGKSLLIGTSWLGQYYFDANRAVTAAATDLEHAYLRSEEFYNQNHDPVNGRFSSGSGHSLAAPSNGPKTFPGIVWVGDYRSSRAITGYSAEIQGIKGYDTSNIETTYGRNDKTGAYDVPFQNKMGASGEHHARKEAGEILDAVYKVAPVAKTLWSGQRNNAFSKYLKPGDTIDLPTTATTSKESEAHYYPKQGGTVLRFDGGTKAVRITRAAAGIPEWVTAGRFVVSSVSEKPHQIKGGTVREVTLHQTHVFDRTMGSWVSAREIAAPHRTPIMVVAAAYLLNQIGDGYEPEGPTEG